MPSDKTRSFIIDPATSEAINSRSGDALNFSQSVNVMIGRYAHFVSQSIPKLTAEEWQILIDVVPRGVDQAWSIDGIENPIRAAAESSEVAARVRNDLGQFQAKIKRMSLAQKMSILDTVERFRAVKKRGEKTSGQFPWE